MKGRLHELREEEVISQNRLAARSQAEAPLDDPAVLYVLETAVGGSDHRIYELSLGRLIARLAEDLTRMEDQIEAMRRHPAGEAEPVAVGAGHDRPRRRAARC